uniref:RNase H type-1 domain-containing protein n=1 Tax=Cannabis sativa TaxID=3483 RepID=A0A803PUK0_CANSA
MDASAPSYSTSKPKWLAPPSGRLKLNTDDAIDKSKSFIGVGAILRDSSGAIVAVIFSDLAQVLQIYPSLYSSGPAALSLIRSEPKPTFSRKEQMV